MPRVMKGGNKRYELDKLEMPDLLAIEPLARRKIMYNAAKIVALRVRQIAPDSGKRHKRKLSKTITYRAFASGVKSMVSAKAPHAHLVHDGTKPHQEFAHTPETAKGGWRFYHGSTQSPVNHPGARGQPFLIEARDQTREEVERQMRVDMDAVAAAVAAGETA